MQIRQILLQVQYSVFLKIFNHKEATTLDLKKQVIHLHVKNGLIITLKSCKLEKPQQSLRYLRKTNLIQAHYQ